MMLTRDQEFAKLTYDQIHEIWAKDKKYQKKYGSLAHKLPVLVRQAGLAQALAFAATRKPEAQRQLLQHLASVVLHDNGGADALLEQSRTLPLPQYMRLTDDVMLALTWYKRYVQSVLGIDATDEEEGGE